jgi:Glycosyl hydrolase family 3 C-terminal domain
VLTGHERSPFTARTGAPARDRQQRRPRAPTRPLRLPTRPPALGDRQSPVQLVSEWRSTRKVPDLDAAHRIPTGIDLNPLDPRREIVRVWIDGRQVVSYAPFHEPFQNGLIHLTAGPHSIRAEITPFQATLVTVDVFAISPGLHLGWQPQENLMIEQAAATARAADVAVVVVSVPASEGMDRSSLALPADQDKLIAVASANPRTVRYVRVQVGLDVSIITLSCTSRRSVPREQDPVETVAAVESDHVVVEASAGPGSRWKDIRLDPPHGHSATL